MAKTIDFGPLVLIAAASAFSEDKDDYFFTVPLGSLDDEHINNLARIATYLESLPEGYGHFQMAWFANEYDEDGTALLVSEEAASLFRHYVEYDGPMPCGSAACAVGHGPSAGLFLTKEEAYNTGEGIDWSGYSERISGFSAEGVAWEFMFGGTWGSNWSKGEPWYDNHHWGAAARIRYLLDSNELCTRRWLNKYIDYSKYRVTEAKPLPKDFYTPAMLERMEEGRKLREKETLVSKL